MRKLLIIGASLLATITSDYGFCAAAAAMDDDGSCPPPSYTVYPEPADPSWARAFPTLNKCRKTAYRKAVLEGVIYEGAIYKGYGGIWEWVEKDATLLYRLPSSLCRGFDETQLTDLEYRAELIKAADEKLPDDAKEQARHVVDQSFRLVEDNKEIVINYSAVIMLSRLETPEKRQEIVDDTLELFPGKYCCKKCMTYRLAFIIKSDEERKKIIDANEDITRWNRRRLLAMWGRAMDR